MSPAPDNYLHSPLSPDAYPSASTPVIAHPSWSLGSLINNFLYSGIKNFDDNRFRTQIFFVNTFSLLGALSLITFGLLHILSESNLILGYYEILGGSILLINQFFMRLTHHVELAKFVLLFTVMIFLWLMFITGGTRNTGIFWYFTYPAAAFFLTGNRRGLLWMTTLYIGTLVFTFLDYTSQLDVPYNLIEIRQLLISLGVVSTLIYLYEHNRQRIETDLIYDEQSLQEFLDNTSTFAVKLDTGGKILLANRIAKQAIGLGNQVIGHSFVDGPWLTHDSLAHSRFKDILRQVLAGKTVTYYENLRLADSTIAIYSFSLAPIIHNHKVKYLVVEGRDVTSLMNAKYSFNEAEKVAHLGSWEWDIPQDKLTWSEGLYRIFGIDRSVTLNHRQYFSFIHPDDQDLVQYAFENSSKTLQRFSVDYRITRPDGELRFYHDEGKVLVDHTGTPIKMVGIGQDITELRQLQSQLKNLSH